MMPDKTCEKIFTYIENDPKLYKDLEYLYNYIFTGLDWLNGQPLGNVIYDWNGWVGLCRDMIFWWWTNTGPYIDPSKIKSTATYALGWLTFLVAMDMFVTKFKDTMIKNTADSKIKLVAASFDRSTTTVNIILDTDCKSNPTASGIIVEAVIKPDGNLNKENMTDLIATLRIPNATKPGTYVMTTLKILELNKSLLEDDLTIAGW